MLYWLLPAAGYLIGSVSSAIVVSALLRLPDPRTSGSRNPGATNVLRLGSKLGGLLTLAGDIAKGLLPVLAVSCWISDHALLLAATGLGAFLGHLFPLYFKFTGGKGVATALGVVLAIHPLIALIQIATWLLVALVFRYSSLAALVTAAATPLYLWLAGDETSFIVLGAVLAVLLFWRHRQNIERLIARTESKVRLGR
jgi:glycerol-3-phosphate acyltransferase PlsY